MDLTRYTETHEFIFDDVFDETASNEDVGASCLWSPFYVILFFLYLYLFCDVCVLCCRHNRFGHVEVTLIISGNHGCASLVDVAFSLT